MQATALAQTSAVNGSYGSIFAIGSCPATGPSPAPNKPGRKQTFARSEKGGKRAFD
jgi:hypothetical protein